MKGKTANEIIEVLSFNYYGAFLNLLTKLIDDLEINPEDCVKFDYSNYHGDYIEFSISANDYHIESCMTHIHDLNNPVVDYGTDDDIAEFIMSKVKALRAMV